jgi:hypothetical protein
MKYLRRGIMSRDQVPTQLTGIKARYSMPFVAFTLLRDFEGELSPDDELRLAFIYSAIPGGAFNMKGTLVDKYAAFDVAADEEIDKAFPAGAAVRVHDMAVSSGITSLELFDRLKHRDKFSLHATDLYDALSVVSVPGGNWQVVFDAVGAPLQFIGKRTVVQATKLVRFARRRYPLNWILQRFLLMTVLPRARRILKTEADKDGGAVSRIRLFHPKCLAASRDDPRFTLGRDDLFAPADGFYEVLRIMGVVKYLPVDRIEPMFRAITEHIVDGGLLIVASHGDTLATEPGPAAIFQRRGGRFVMIREMVSGYPYADVILGLDLTE